MLRRLKDLKAFVIGAKDGDIGVASDFIFDDKNWTIRYVVVDTNPWLPGGKVIISPIIMAQADWEAKRLPVLLTREQVKNSPDIRMDEDLSAQDEMKYFDHYGWPYYWVGAGTWGPVTTPHAAPPPPPVAASRAPEPEAPPTPGPGGFVAPG